MSGIKHQIIVALADYLKLKCQTEIATSDPARAKLVKPYRFQVSPVDFPVYAWVSGNDPTDILQKDARISAEDMENLGMHIPYGEIGGGHFWWIRGVVGVGAFYTTSGFSEVKAADQAHIFFGRVMYHLERASLSGLVDQFGERVHSDAIVFGANFIEGGGPDEQYLWRGQIWWQVLTHRPK